jgi:hypothetical protein
MIVRVLSFGLRYISVAKFMILPVAWLLENAMLHGAIVSLLHCFCYFTTACPCLYDILLRLSEAVAVFSNSSWRCFACRKFSYIILGSSLPHNDSNAAQGLPMQGASFSRLDKQTRTSHSPIFPFIPHLVKGHVERLQKQLLENYY